MLFPEIGPRYNLAPSQDVPVIRWRETGPELAYLHWGLVPHWAKEIKTGYATINARIETAATKPAFRSAWRHRRAIFPASGYYEWAPTGKGKQPYYFVSDDGQELAMAGLWEHWEGEGQVLESCTVLVGPPDPEVAPIHDRSPVLLADAAVRSWLDPATPLEDLPILVASPHAPLRSWPVSKAVNRAGVEGADLIAPVPAS